MLMGDINNLDETQIREKIRELAIEFGIRGYNLMALWTLINRLIEIKCSQKKTKKKYGGRTIDAADMVLDISKIIIITVIGFILIKGLLSFLG